MPTLKAPAHHEVRHLRSGWGEVDASSRQGRVEPLVVYPNDAAVDGGRPTKSLRGSPLLPLSIRKLFYSGPRSPVDGRHLVNWVGRRDLHERLKSRAQSLLVAHSGYATTVTAADTSSGLCEDGTEAMRSAAHDGQQPGVSWQSAGPGVSQNRTLFLGPDKRLTCGHFHNHNEQEAPAQT
jgi:hypothetical protein